MKKGSKYLDTSLFSAGERVVVGKDKSIKLPLEAEQEILIIPTEDGYRLIPLQADIKRVYIEVTTKCNFDCITCIRSSWQDCSSHMEWETFENILKNLKELPKLESVHFGGFGEPMMHPRIMDMLRAVKALDLKVEMITNGSYLKKGNIQQLIDIELDVLFTSLDSPEEEEYNEIRQGADFLNVSGNVALLQSMKRELQVKKPELGIEFVAMKKNYNKLPKLIRMAYDIGASQIIVSNLLPYHESMKDEILYDMDDTGRMFGSDSLLTTIKAQMSSMRLRTERSCKFVKDNSLCINYLGEVSPCYALMHTYHCYIYGRKKEIYPCYLGNVNNASLNDIWTDSGYVNFRRNVRENHFPSCTDCRALQGCSYTDSNEMDCWGNSPSCGECLWARRIIACP